MVFELTDSKQDNRFVYDELQVNFNTACYNFAFPTATGSEVTGMTYQILPVSVPAPLTVTYADNGATSCDDTLAVSWYYKQ